MFAYVLFLFYSQPVNPPVDLTAASQQIAAFAVQEQFTFQPYYGGDFAAHIDANRQEWESVREFPQPFHAARFSLDRNEAHSRLSFYRDEIERVKILRDLHMDRPAQFDLIIEDLQYRFNCWDALADAWQPNDSYARRRLNDLKTLLGESWVTGEMP